jgi:glutamate racemase
MDTKNLPIGVFDSGVGGLTVAREIFRNLPNEKIIYFGDTARVPYGNKSPETIIRYSKQISEFLISRHVKAIVIACNTASAMALDAVQATTDIPVIGVVKPGADAAVHATVSGRIGVIGTVGTIASGLYDRYIKEIMPSAQVFGKACPLFCPLVEEGMLDDNVTVEMIHRYLDDMIEENDIDTLVLGCTHYPLIRTVIAREIGGTYADAADYSSKSVHREAVNGKPVQAVSLQQCDAVHQNSAAKSIKLVNPAYTTAIALKALLAEHGIASDTPAQPSDHQFFVSDVPDSFRAFASNVLNLDIDTVTQKVL